MGKLQAETKVRVKESLIVGNKYGGLTFHSGMSEYQGEIATVRGTTHYNENAHYINIDTNGYNWSSDMLEVVSVNRCTFCGREDDSPLYEVEGYQVLDSCEDCEEEIKS